MKRLVAIYPEGLHQIIGLADVPPEVLCEEPFYSLVRVTARAAYYKTPTKEASYTLSEGQK
jgi:hypothetical protein